MDPMVVGYVGAGLLFVFLGIGIPVGVAMGVIGVGGMLLGAGELFAWGQLRNLPFWVVNNYAFAVLPMFVLMGVLAESSGVTRDVFYSSDLWLRRFRGGPLSGGHCRFGGFRRHFRINNRQRGRIHAYRVSADAQVWLLAQPFYWCNCRFR